MRFICIGISFLTLGKVVFFANKFGNFQVPETRGMFAFQLGETSDAKENPIRNLNTWHKESAPQNVV